VKLDGHPGQTEDLQAGFLSESLSVAYEAGMAGAFIFSWTDEWHTGGYDIHEWSFGLVDENRQPKKSYESVTKVFDRVPQCAPLKSVPKISVVVATCNGAATLTGCLESLERLDYPNYEIIVVDDGSTDETQTILKRFPGIRVITQTTKVYLRRVTPESGLQKERSFPSPTQIASPIRTGSTTWRASSKRGILSGGRS